MTIWSIWLPSESRALLRSGTSTPGIVADLDLDQPRPAGDPGAAAVDQAQPAGIDRADLGGAAERPLGQDRQIMRPAVVRAQLVAADDHQIRDGAGEISAARSRSTE